MKRRWYILALLLSLLIGCTFGQVSWNLGSSEDWLSIGPVKPVGPYYIPNSDLPIAIQRFLAGYPSYPPIYSDLPIGLQRFLADFPGYPPIYYPSYYPTYYPYNYYLDSFPLEHSV